MISSKAPASFVLSNTARERGPAVSQLAKFLLLTIVLGSTIALAQQAGTAKTAPKAPDKATTAKHPTNPLTSILNGKPAVPVANQELPAALPEPTATASIPLPEVAARSQELGQMLRDFSGQLPSSDQLESMRKSLTELEPELQSKQKEVDALLSASPNSLEVREQETYWRGMQTYTSTWQNQLLAWANNAQGAIQKLDQQEPIWAATLQENEGVHDLDPVVALIASNLSDIRKLRAQAKDELQSIVTMQIQASADVEMAGDVLDRLAQARKQLTGRLLDRDSLPLWKIAMRHEAGENSQNYGTFANRKIAIEAFAHENSGALVIILALLIVSQILAYRLHVLERARNVEPDTGAGVRHILKHWFALGLLPPLMFGYLLVPECADIADWDHHPNFVYTDPAFAAGFSGAAIPADAVLPRRFQRV